MPQESVDAELCARFREIRRFYAPTQAKFAELFNIPRSTVSDIEREAINPPQKILIAIVGKGDFNPGWVIRGVGPKTRKEVADTIEESAPPYVTGVLPEHVQEAYDILLAAVDASGADFKKLDRRRAGLVVGLIAEEVSKGLQAETRLTLIRRAEVLLGLKG